MSLGTSALALGVPALFGLAFGHYFFFLFGLTGAPPFT